MILGIFQYKLIKLVYILQIYESVLFFHGIPEGEFDARWKSFHAVKKALEDKVCAVYLKHYLQQWT
jgi:hypothetical protein